MSRAQWNGTESHGRPTRGTAARPLCLRSTDFEFCSEGVVTLGPRRASRDILGTWPTAMSRRAVRACWLQGNAGWQTARCARRPRASWGAVCLRAGLPAGRAGFAAPICLAPSPTAGGSPPLRRPPVSLSKPASPTQPPLCLGPVAPRTQILEQLGLSPNNVLSARARRTSMVWIRLRQVIAISPKDTCSERQGKPSCGK